MIDWRAGTWIVSPDYFRTMGIPMLHGREFERRDGESAPRAVIVSKGFAERLWPSIDPTGRQFEILKLRKDLYDQVRKNPMALDEKVYDSPGSWEPDGAPWQVVGEVGNVRAFGLDLKPQPALYIDYRQQVWFGGGPEKFVLRTTLAPLKLAPIVKEQVMAAEKDIRVDDITTMSDLVTESIGGRGSNKLLL
jgi:putative ABC transport system permease protein